MTDQAAPAPVEPLVPAAAADAASPASLPPNCLNCDAPLRGRYCHECGQKALAGDLDLHHFVHDATHEFLHLDGKIVRTLKLLALRPGQLTVEFLAGRRARSISPLRVYLTFSVLFFTLAALLPGTMDGIVTIKSGKLDGGTQFERKLDNELSKANQDKQRVVQSVMKNVPKVMFLLMPIFALLTWAFYRKQQRFYIPHLYYAVHFHAFVFLAMSIYVIASRAGVPRPIAAPIILTAVPYHFVALRRVFGGTRRITFAKGTAIGVTYWLIAMLAVLGVTFSVLMAM